MSPPKIWRLRWSRKRERERERERERWYHAFNRSTNWHTDIVKQQLYLNWFVSQFSLSCPLSPSLSEKCITCKWAFVLFWSSTLFSCLVWWLDDLSLDRNFCFFLCIHIHPNVSYLLNTKEVMLMWYVYHCIIFGSLGSESKWCAVFILILLFLLMMKTWRAFVISIIIIDGFHTSSPFSWWISWSIFLWPNLLEIFFLPKRNLFHNWHSTKPSNKYLSFFCLFLCIVFESIPCL